MAGLSRTSISSRSGGRRESLDETNQGDSVVFDKKIYPITERASGRIGATAEGNKERSESVTLKV